MLIQLTMSSMLCQRTQTLKTQSVSECCVYAKWPLILSSFSVVEGKRSAGLTAIWLARNRFAMLDKSHQVGTWRDERKKGGGTYVFVECGYSCFRL